MQWLTPSCVEVLTLASIVDIVLILSKPTLCAGTKRPWHLVGILEGYWQLLWCQPALRQLFPSLDFSRYQQMQNCSTDEGLNTNLAPSGKRWKSGGVGIGGLALLVDRVARRRRARVAAAARRVRGVRTTSLYKALLQWWFCRYRRQEVNILDRLNKSLIFDVFDQLWPATFTPSFQTMLTL